MTLYIQERRRRDPSAESARVPHGESIIDFDNLVQGGQLLFLDANGVTSCLGDVDGSGYVTFTDLLIRARHVGRLSG